MRYWVMNLCSFVGYVVCEATSIMTPSLPRGGIDDICSFRRDQKQDVFKAEHLARHGRLCLRDNRIWIWLQSRG